VVAVQDIRIGFRTFHARKTQGFGVIGAILSIEGALGGSKKSENKFFKKMIHVMQRKNSSIDFS